MKEERAQGLLNSQRKYIKPTWWGWRVSNSWKEITNKDHNEENATGQIFKDLRAKMIQMKTVLTEL